MLVIANNLSFRNREFVKAAKEGDRLAMSTMAEVLKRVGADIINVNLSLDGEDDERYMAGAVGAVQKAGLPISIDSRNPRALMDGAAASAVPVIMNYVSAEPRMSKVMDEVLKAAVDKGADVVLYALREGTPKDADERLAIISELVERANAAGIPNGRLVVDPVILHLGGGIGQRHAVAVQETLYGLRELVEPPIRTTCWLSNVSAGAPRELRAIINDTFLPMLAGLGLWSAYLDAMDKETMRTVRLIRALKDEALYSLSDAAL